MGMWIDSARQHQAPPRVDVSACRRRPNAADAPDFYRGVATFCTVLGSSLLLERLEEWDYSREKLEVINFRKKLLKATCEVLGQLKFSLFIDNYDFIKDSFFMAEMIEQYSPKNGARIIISANIRNPEKLPLHRARNVKLFPRNPAGFGRYG